MQTATTEPAKKTDSAAPFLAIATRSFKGVARGTKVDGMKNKAFIKTRKVAHVGMFVQFEVLDKVNRAAKSKGHPYFMKKVYREVENLAEFDGPTCEDACKTFLEMLPRCTKASGIRCKADGKEAAVKTWNKVDAVTAIQTAV